MRKIALTLILIIVFLNIYQITVLEIIDDKEERLIYQTFTKPHEKFSIMWIHSVSKQPVTETYMINEDLSIGIYEMIFNEPGPNLPSGPEGGTLWEIKDGKFRVYNYDIILSEVPVRIGEVIANHTVIYKNTEIELKRLSRPGGFVKIRVCRMSLFYFFYREVIRWRN
jgi:hypothetical protein